MNSSLLRERAERFARDVLVPNKAGNGRGAAEADGARGRHARGTGSRFLRDDATASRSAAPRPDCSR